jgi:hypothetical protein
VCVTTTRADGREAWMDERRHATSEAASWRERINNDNRNKTKKKRRIKRDILSLW